MTWYAGFVVPKRSGRYVTLRSEFGHLEADVVLFARGKWGEFTPPELWSDEMFPRPPAGLDAWSEKSKRLWQTDKSDGHYAAKAALTALAFEGANIEDT